MNIFGTLKAKAGPLPIWAWAAIGTGLLALFLMRRNSQNDKQNKAAADQTNSDLGSASELANLFNVAGLMPYQGGNIYINTSEEKKPPPVKTLPWQPPKGHKPPPKDFPPYGHGKLPGKWPHPTHRPRAVYTVKQGDTLSGIAAKYGTTADNLFKFNTTPGVRSRQSEATIKKRGKNLIIPGEKIYIPEK